MLKFVRTQLQFALSHHQPYFLPNIKQCVDLLSHKLTSDGFVLKDVLSSEKLVLGLE